MERARRRIMAGKFFIMRNDQQHIVFSIGKIFDKPKFKSKLFTCPLIEKITEQKFLKNLKRLGNDANLFNDF